MVDISVLEFCDKIKYNKFGGAAEMVEDGIKSIVLAARTCDVSNVEEFSNRMEADVDAILGVIESIAPMTNLLHAYMSEIDEIRQRKFELDAAREKVVNSLENYLDRQSKALGIIGQIGGQMIKNNDKVATFSTSGSVMAMFKAAREEGKEFTAVVTEARPANEGIRTMTEMTEMGIPVTFGVDAILSYLIPGSSMFIAGADVINSLGDVLAKVGTYLGALMAREYGVPFYVAADSSKFDPLTIQGFPLKLNLQGPDRVLDGTTPEGAFILNPSFEMIPAHLVTGYITEMGLISPGSVTSVMRQAKLSESLTVKLRDWVNNPN